MTGVYKPTLRVSASFTPSEVGALDSLCKAVLEGRDLRVIARNPAMVRIARKARSLAAAAGKAEKRRAEWTPAAVSRSGRSAVSASRDEQIVAAIARGVRFRQDIAAAVGASVSKVRHSLDLLSALDVVEFRGKGLGWRVVRQEAAE